MILSGNPEGGRIYSKLLSANAVFKKARAMKHPSRNGGFSMTHGTGWILQPLLSPGNPSL